MAKAVRFDRHGGIDELYVADVPAPEATPGRVVVEVRAAGVTPARRRSARGS